MKHIIESIKNDLTSGAWKPTDQGFWVGADLIITDKATDEAEIVVITKHATGVSSLVIELRDRLTDYIDFANKYEFYGRIGIAANRAIIEQGDKFPAIANAILTEASAIADEWDCYLYFAYGSNMDIAQMAHRCPGAKVLSTGVARNYEFAIDNRGVATILPKSGSTVEGLLWIVTKRNIASLDRYEGIAGGFYRKETLQLEISNTRHDALVYLSNGSCNKPGYRPGYMEMIITAAEDHRLSGKYVDMLKSKLKGIKNTNL